MIRSFFNKYKVVIFGLLSAVALGVNEAMKGDQSSTKVLIFAAALAAASFLANNLRGQWATIAGLVGTAISTYVTMETTGSVSWQQLILQFVIGFLAIVSAPAKSRGYEHSVNVQNAKAEGERLTPTLAQP